MASIKDSARTFVPKHTKNIADLESVHVDLEIYHDGKGIDKDGEEFTYSYVLLNNEEYRVPNSVLMQLQDLIAENTNMTRFKVKKTGEGLKTRYTVIPLI